MCRHLAYLGPPVTLRAAIIDPPYGLYRQAWAPRMMRNSGTMNVDGFGVGWYADGDPVPARYRHAGPIWADPSFADLTRVTRSGALLAAVRDASAGTEPGASACSPYGADHWLFSHNGTLTGWPGSAAGLAATLSPLELLSLDARVDSALLWALTLHQLRAGATPEEALAAVIGLLDVAEVTGRFNFLLTDGATIAATAAGHTLWYRQTPPRPPDNGHPGPGGRGHGDRSNGDRSRGDRVPGDRSRGHRAPGDQGTGDLGPGDRSNGDRGPGDRGPDLARDRGPVSVIVASEPADEEPGWIEVPDRSLLTATPAAVRVRSLATPPEVDAEDAERVRRASFPDGMAGSSIPNGRNPRK